MKILVKPAVYFGILCLVISVIFRLVGEGYIVPYVRISASSMMTFTSVVFLLAIGMGVAELVDSLVNGPN